MLREMKRVIELGKVDATGNGRKDNAVSIEIEVRRKDKKKRTVDLDYVNGYHELSIAGDVWNRSRTDIIMGGQCYDEIARLFPRNVAVRQLVTIWKRWHLNDMNSASRRQQEVLNYWWSIIPEFPNLPDDLPSDSLLGLLLADAVANEPMIRHSLYVAKPGGIAVFQTAAYVRHMLMQYQNDVRFSSTNYADYQAKSLAWQGLVQEMFRNPGFNSRPDHYKSSKAILTLENLYRDDGYQYGSAWLVEPLPDEVVERIVSLIDILDGDGEDEEEERILPRDYKFYQSGMASSNSGWAPGTREWTLEINGERFSYHTGPAIRDVKPEDALASLFSDAQYEDWDVQEMCDELGFKPKEAKRVLEAIKSNTKRLRRALGWAEYARLTEIYSDY